MKLYEFVDKLYAMGDIESPKTVRSKTTLNESLMLEASSGEMLDRFFELNVGVDPEELLQWILQNVITDEQLREMVDYAEEIEHMHAQDDYYESLDDLEEGLNEDKDLSAVKGSMTKILQDNREKIDACGSAKEVHDTVAGLLAEAGLDTPATRRLLLTLKKQRGLTGALQAVYNSILKGSDLGTLK